MNKRRKQKLLKKRVAQTVHAINTPNRAASSWLHRIWKHDRKMSEFVIGLILFCLAIIFSSYWERHLWTHVAGETIKTVGLAPLVRLLLDALKWEG